MLAQKKFNISNSALALDGSSLSMSKIYRYIEDVSSHTVLIDDHSRIRMQESVSVLNEKLASNQVIYGVNTRYGAMARERRDDYADLQTNLILNHHAGSGKHICIDDAKLTMLLRMNSLCKGVSGIRPEVLERYAYLLNHDITPEIREHGSIGASGDLVPLSAAAGAALGLSDEFRLYHQGQWHPAKTLLKELGLPSIELGPKEGLALINGTSCHTAISINNIIRFIKLLDTSLRVHALIAEIMESDMRPFSEFVQNQRPHPGQKAIAQIIRSLLQDSEMVSHCPEHHHNKVDDKLVQQRYSIRCMPQFLGPIYEGCKTILGSLEIEANSTSDNPMIDAPNNSIYHGGNFLGQHAALAMDQLRVYSAMLAKHNDAQIAMLVEPTFNDGLPASLYDDEHPEAIVGIKPLQINSNSLVPMIEKLADPISTRFPIYAEQFNQNVNSQAFNASTLTRESLKLLEEQLSVTMIIANKAKAMKSKNKQRLKWSSSSTCLSEHLDKVMNNTVQTDEFRSFQTLIEDTTSLLRTGALTDTKFEHCHKLLVDSSN